MNILEKIAKISMEYSEHIALRSIDESMTYADLWMYSDKLATWIDGEVNNKEPIVVYGHKSPWMIVCFLACVKSGHAYCPVDISTPPERILSIINAVNNNIVLSCNEISIEHEKHNSKVIDVSDLIGTYNNYEPISEGKWIQDDDVFYIIFTSGSTGEPKGVQITTNNLTKFVEWAVTLGDNEIGKIGKVFLNQAPFSFDLSVMDLYTCLASGGTLHCLNKDLQGNIGEMLKYMKDGNLNYWVSTPSFADMCLADSKFCEELLPNLRVFLFCGEKLTKDTAKKLYDRFKKAVVVNTYGPTESTVAVTEITIDKDMIDDGQELPIGMSKPGTTIRIIDDEERCLKDGERGEIQIIGDTVSPGYFNNRVKTFEVFGECEIENQRMRTYRTGDKGYLDNGILYYCGRMDLQIKFHGYRIELGDIESNILKLDDVRNVAVIPQWNNGKIRHLVAFIVKDNCDGSFEERKKVRNELKNRLPEYMVPKKILFIDQIPLTNNGKADRRKLEELL